MDIHTFASKSCSHRTPGVNNQAIHAWPRVCSHLVCFWAEFLTYWFIFLGFSLASFCAWFLLFVEIYLETREGYSREIIYNIESRVLGCFGSNWKLLQAWGRRSHGKAPAGTSPNWVLYDFDGWFFESRLVNLYVSLLAKVKICLRIKIPSLKQLMNLRFNWSNWNWNNTIKHRFEI